MLGDEGLIFAQGNLRTSGFRERLGAAAQAGFDAVGMNLRTYDALRADGWSDDALRGAFDDHGVRLLELEAVVGFDADPDGVVDPRLPRTAPTDVVRLLELADRFGCRHVQAVGSLGEDLGRDAVERFAALCDLAGAHGLLVALEFIPCTNVPDAAAAMEIVQSADRVNGGLCVDIWHHVRGANDLGQLGAIPRERIVVVQLDDGPLVAADDDYMEDTRYNRVATGEGEFDLTAFLMVFEGAGAPISVEVLSRELDAVDVAVAARRIGDGARNVLRAAQRGRSVHQQS